MAYLKEDYPVLNVTDSDLLKLDEFVDRTLNEEPSFLKLGFLKVKLCDYRQAEQKAVVQQFFRKFPATELVRDVRRILLVKGPDDNGLLGHMQVQATHEQASQYVNRAMQDKHFTTGEGECDSCCMNVLRRDGVEALLSHLEEVVERHTQDAGCRMKDAKQIQNRAAKKRYFLDQRRKYLNEPDPKKRREELDFAMVSEKVCHETDEECQCRSCKYRSVQAAIVDDETPLLYCAGIEETAEQCLHLTANFAMSHVTFTNSLAALDGVYAGVSYPNLYLGAEHSPAAVHVEDLSLNSFNISLAGAERVWMVVPPPSVRLLNEALCRKGFGGLHQQCMNRLHHKYFITLAKFLVSENIPFTFVRQRPGEGIILLPNAAHGVFNLGINLAQACNFATKHPGNMVHEDLGNLVAILRPDLLRPYLQGDIYGKVRDQYFQSSVIVPGPSNGESTASASSSSLPSKKKMTACASSGKACRGGERNVFTCPICKRTAWDSIRKDRIKSHLLRYHKQCLDDYKVKEFLQVHNIDLD